MRKALYLAMAAFIAILATGSIFAEDEKGVHHGEIVAVDTSAKSITLKYKTEGLETKETNVFFVTAKTTILDADDKPMPFENLKAGMKVKVKTHKDQGRREVIEIQVKPEKNKQ